MADQTPAIRQLVEQRVALENQLQNEHGELSDSVSRRYDDAYAAIQRQLAALFGDTGDDSQRITIMLEMMRILENRLVYLQHFVVDPSSDNRILARLVTQFIDQVARERSNVLTSLEAIYYRAVAALYAGEAGPAREGFQQACASEESDEANDIKYKSYVMLGHLSHEDHDYAQARELHDRSLRYSQNDNVTAQALALKALNSYALQDHDEALRLFEGSLRLFNPDQPHFNSYFHRNALLFCGAIYFDRKQYPESEEVYRRVLDAVEPSSYDYFDALSHLGRIHYAQERYDDAVSEFEKAVAAHKFSENESIVDTYFWIARAHLKRGRADQARPYLEKVAATEVRYEKKSQAVELLRKVS
ncbi:MAG TPA: tetratricopeptide repeat protein [Thermoanaerobaculia bacterium]|nr:tetratricopeptide repeat protein [Thermoanaerobaculia bacterium]